MINRRTSFVALFLLIGVSAFLGSTLTRTYFDYNFDKFFKPDDQATQYYQVHRDTFSTDNDFILIGLTNEKGVFEKDFLSEVKRLTNELTQMPYVVNVLSPTNAVSRIQEPLTGAIFERPLLTGKTEKDSIRVFTDPSVISNLFSKDTNAVSIVVSTEEYLSKEECDELATDINRILAGFEFDDVAVSGRAIGQVVYIEKIQGEFILFMVIALVFVTVLLFIMFRSIRGIILPLVTVLLAVVWSVGIMNLTGSGISILLSMLPPVIFVVGMSDAVHLYSRYIEELRNGEQKYRAIRLMVIDTGLATLLTSITTSIGFASLWFTGIPALQEFGLLTAAGVLAAFIIAILLIPSWLVLSPEPSRAVNSPNITRWDGFLIPLFNLVMNEKRKVFLGAAVLTVLMTIALSGITLNNYLLEDLKEGEKLRKDFTFFDNYFSGVRPFDLGIKWKTLGPSDTEYWKALEKVDTYLKENYKVGAITSPLEVIKEINRSKNSGRNQYYDLPENESRQKSIIKEYDKILNTGKLSFLSTTDGGYIRMLGRVGDLGAQHFTEQNAGFERFLEREGLNDLAEFTITGTGTLIDRTNQTLVYSLSKGLGAAFFLIAVLMGIMFRSIRMVVIALIPNLLPLIAVGAVMSLFNIHLNMSTGIIFTIAFGIAVDDTIHLLSRFKLELVKGSSTIDAIKKAYLYTGKALIITSIILFGGFIGLCFSTFQSTYFIGLFVTLTLMFALFFDFALLPPLVSAAAKDQSPSPLTSLPKKETTI